MEARPGKVKCCNVLQRTAISWHVLRCAAMQYTAIDAILVVRYLSWATALHSATFDAIDSVRQCNVSTSMHLEGVYKQAGEVHNPPCITL